MERAMNARDASYDGIFYICVRTTGIFCRPSCSARKPKLKNVVFLHSVRDCLLGGFRPCKRCHPLALDKESATWLEQLINLVERSPGERYTDANLSELGFSPFRIRRYFTRNLHMTFQAYHRARRMGMALRQLRSGDEADAVAVDQGYESLSGFRDSFKRVFGTTPGDCDSIDCIYTKKIDSPIGPLVAGATTEGVCLLEFADRRAFQKQVATLRSRLKAACVPGRNAHLDQLERELREYFSGSRTEFTVPLVIAGNDFQTRVWNELRRVPHGKTMSYSELARQIGAPGAQRAVGRTNGENRIAIVIPCHRVVRSDGTLCGYGGGVWRKKFLLDLEQKSSALFI
ncbi:MAG: methylated-DNA--[protein]-cysteine S-methyltransferase [Planctomycetes bacterium]|nr:methylated-DNA--[protein]-cysteine S-methyltransferase [Planctomycetota bacterium]